MLFSLAMLPLHDVENGFLQVAEEFPELDGTEDFLNYFEFTYVRGRQMRNGRRRNPLFSPEHWNHHTSITEGLARTTNSIEGWHSGLQSLFQCSHPTIWRFLNGLQKEISLQHAYYLQHVSGQRIPQKKKYRELNTRVERIVASYDPANKMEYLRTLAHVF
ncbi:uncharacterized protein LOC116176531 [Photinus pyralis]|uniref:uncharacterized protein LOC116176531 n=1 Tax=Photinus pyralis TaxID=7054 RepID=UPI001266FBCB|nr:uncharacterized protein LOC116176531 [Photinus pyralis]